MAETHYEEQDKKRKHVFNIDFTDLYTYLNPRQASDDTVDNVGCIYYIFNHKNKDHRYCILPTTAWKLVDHIFEAYNQAKEKDVGNKDFDEFINDEKINKFHGCIDETDETNFEQIITCYEELADSKKQNGLAEIVTKALKCKLNENLRQNLEVIKDMLSAKVLEPIENFVGNDLSQIRLSEEIYSRALASLKIYDYQNPIYKKIPAYKLAKENLTKIAIYKKMAVLHVAMTYSLTMYDTNKDELYHESYYFSAVYVSSELSNAFRMLTTNEGKYISCCPQFLATLILLSYSEIENKLISCLYENRKCFERIKNVCFDLQYPQKFAKGQDIEDKARANQRLESLCSYLSDLLKVKSEIYPKFIAPIMKISAGDETYHNPSKNYNVKEPLASLKKLFDTRYEEVVIDSIDSIYDDVQETCEILKGLLSAPKGTTLAGKERA